MYIQKYNILFLQINEYDIYIYIYIYIYITRLLEEIGWD
jgi:hypothetical protein